MAVREGEGEGVLVYVGVGVLDGDGVTVRVYVGVKVTVRVNVGVGVRVRVGVKVGEFGFCVGDLVAVGDGVKVGVQHRTSSVVQFDAIDTIPVAPIRA